MRYKVVLDENGDSFISINDLRLAPSYQEVRKLEVNGRIPSIRPDIENPMHVDSRDMIYDDHDLDIPHHSFFWHMFYDVQKKVEKTKKSHTITLVIHPFERTSVESM